MTLESFDPKKGAKLMMGINLNSVKKNTDKIVSGYALGSEKRAVR